MKLWYPVVCFIGFGLNACTRHVPKDRADATINDTVNYTYKSIKQRVPGCGNKPDSDCTVAQIRYPVFANQKVLNDTITRKLLSIFEFGDRKNTSLNQLAESVIKTYEGDKDSINNGMPYTLDLFVKIRRQDSSLVVLEFGGYAYSGGAHGSSQNIFINWNSKAGKEITMGDIFNNGYKESLNKIAENIFRKDEKLSDTASLANAYFFDKNKFSLNENFMITPTGIRFLYNEYEIKPYAEGQTELFISYAQIKSLLRPNTVVSQYLK